MILLRPTKEYCSECEHRMDAAELPGECPICLSMPLCPLCLDAHVDRGEHKWGEDGIIRESVGTGADGR